MNWFVSLWTNDSVAHSVLLYAITIAIGVLLGRVKLFGVSLGITWVLFVGIILSHFGFVVNKEVEHFVKEFGLILFVYTVGLQVGPGFFSSLRKQGLAFNMLAVGVVLLGVLVTIALHYITGNPMHIMAGVMSGAVTNTPGLGAAQEALRSIFGADAGARAAELNLGYAVAYPFGVIGIILVMILLQKLTGVNLKKEQELYNERRDSSQALSILHVKVENPGLVDQPLGVLFKILKTSFVVSRIYQDDEIITPNKDTIMRQNDVLMIVASKEDFATLELVIGSRSNTDLTQKPSNLVSRRIVVTQSDIANKPVRELVQKISGYYNITRVNRAGIEFIATGNTTLQIGDIVTVVGREESVLNFASLLGNSLKRLDHPEIAPIFFGIVLGVILGSIPIVIPGIPAPVKVGLAGGPLIIALIISRFGGRFHLATYVTHSANLMLREIGIVLFLASVGLSSGERFVEILSKGDGLMWMLYGAIITAVPLIIMGFISKLVFKKSFFETCGLMAGASTDPPALAFASHMAGCDAPAVTYATVYPLTMILRILCAQFLILIFS